MVGLSKVIDTGNRGIETNYKKKKIEHMIFYIVNELDNYAREKLILILIHVHLDYHLAPKEMYNKTDTINPESNTINHTLTLINRL